jgi:hypothetical protein
VLFWTSRQVLREFLATTRRPGTVVPPGTFGALAEAVRQIEAEFDIADEDAAVTGILLDLLKSRTVQGKQIHDANIVATMRRYGIPSLLTHNTADFTRHLPDINLAAPDFLTLDPRACQPTLMPQTLITGRSGLLPITTLPECWVTRPLWSWYRQAIT